MLTLILRFSLHNPLRHKLRSTLTLAGIIVAALVLGLLETVVTGWHAGGIPITCGKQDFDLG